MTKIITELDIGAEFIIKDNKLRLNTELVDAVLDGMPLRYNLPDGPDGKSRWIELTRLHRVVGSDLYLLSGDELMDLSTSPQPQFLHWNKSYESGTYQESMYDPKTGSQLPWLDTTDFLPTVGNSYFKASYNGQLAVSLTIFYSAQNIYVYDESMSELYADVPLGASNVSYVDVPFVINEAFKKLTPMGLQDVDNNLTLRLKIEVTPDNVQLTMVDMQDSDRQTIPDGVMTTTGGYNGIYTNLFKVERGWAE